MNRKPPTLPPGTICGHFGVHWTRITSAAGTIDVATCNQCGLELSREYPPPGAPYRVGRP